MGQKWEDFHRADEEIQNLKIMLFDPNSTVARDILWVIKKTLLIQTISVSVHKFMTCLLHLPLT